MIGRLRELRNQRMERELGAGYSFERKPCFVCGSLSHLIKDCDYYEKKMAREAALKSQRVVHADVRQATPAWTNTNRVNKANQFTPRHVQLSNIRPNLNTVSSTGTQNKSGRSRFNAGKHNVNSGSVHVNSGTQIKSGSSRFNAGKHNVNSGSVHVNSGTQIKSGSSRFNTGKHNVNSGSVHVNSSVNVNTARVCRPVSNQTSNKTKLSQVNLKRPKKCFSKQSSPVNRPFSRNTAHKSNKYAVKGMGTAVKTLAGCVWRKANTTRPNTIVNQTPDSNVNVSRGPILKIIKNYPKWDLFLLEEVKTEEAAELMVVSSTSLTGATINLKTVLRKLLLAILKLSSPRAIRKKSVFSDSDDVEDGREIKVYVDDIIFGSTNKSWCDEFEALMQSRFQMSSMGKLTFFLAAITPMETKLPLTKDEEAFDVDVHLYRSMIGSLMYLTASRPDIMAHQLGIMDYVATSTTEAEYVAAANCCGQVLWVQNQLLDYGFNFMNTKIHIDNESTICIMKNPVYHSKTKHIEIRHHFIRDCYEKKLISVEKIHTDLNVADLLTKPFDGPWFNYLVVSIGMINP
ncbi:hypothetical protein Tco_0825437 [Tanacetum coccineum]